MKFRGICRHGYTCIFIISIFGLIVNLFGVGCCTLPSYTKDSASSRNFDKVYDLQFVCWYRSDHLLQFVKSAKKMDFGLVESRQEVLKKFNILNSNAPFTRDSRFYDGWHYACEGMAVWAAALLQLRLCLDSEKSIQSNRTKSELLRNALNDIMNKSLQRNNLLSQADFETSNGGVEGLDRWADLKKLSNFQKQVIRSVFVFRSETGGDSTLFITTEDEVYAVGENRSDSNILGITGEYYQCGKVERPVRVEDLSGKNIRVISIGEYVGGALDSEGTLYWWGDCDDTEDKVMPPHLVTRNPKLKFTSITCGSSFIAGISTDDKVFVWGKLEKDRKVIVGDRLPVHQHVVKITSGKRHLVMLTDQGEVYTWGCNDVGQRGSDLHENKKDDFVVRKLQFNQICKDIACGFSSTICLSSSGNIWACGGNSKAWGLSSTGPYSTKLEKITLSSKVTKLIVGWGHIDGSYQSMYIAVATNGEKYVWNDTDGPGLLTSCPVIDLFYENTTPKDIMYTALFPYPTQYCVKCCNCLSSYKINHGTEEMRRKLDVINTIIVEIVRDLENAKVEKGSTLAALTKLIPIINSIATQTDAQEL